MSAIRHGMASSLLAMTMIFCSPNALAQDTNAQRVRYDLPAQPLSDALLKVGEATKRQIVFPGESMSGRTVPQIHGSYTLEEVVKLLLAGTKFTAQFSEEAIFIAGRTEAASSPVTASDAADTIHVTGSRIKGAVSSSPIFKYETQEMRDQGVMDMHSLAAAIPQNFTGGQNPGVGGGGEGRGNENGNSSTALNLRGLGPGATLTLLNGRRMAYQQNNNSVDFSSVPFAAVERVEVMPDGASAIYGSDAVGGVVNIILKRDYEGLWANAVIGGATDGGYLTQSFNAVTGTRWAGGGLMLTGNYDRNTGITAGQRSFAKTANPYLSLYPQMKSYSFVGSVHQDVSEHVTLSMDALYSSRDSQKQTPYTASAPPSRSGLLQDWNAWTLNLMPTATMHLGPWEVTASGVYGRSRSDGESSYYPGPTVSLSMMRNETKVAELSGEGPLVKLPGGDLRLAAGAGFRRDSLVSLVNGFDVQGQQNSYFAYGELSVPLVSPGQQLGWTYRANLDLALRYEDYPNAGRLATPKVGLSWAPTPDAEFKASWGKSFRVPSLYQRLYQTWVLLAPSDFYGAREAPAGQTFLIVGGGNSELKPEKADTLSGTIVLHPRPVPNLNIAVTYYKVKYRNRIATPISSTFAAMDNPLYGNFIQYNPSLDAIAAAIAQAPAGLDDQTGWGEPFDPSSVYAIVDNRYQNVSRDQIQGIDFAANYSIDAEGAGRFNLQASGTYLDSKRVVIAGQLAVDRAGVVYTPPHFKARGGIGWNKGHLAVTSVVTYTGGVKDDRTSSVVNLHSMTTFDLAIKRRFGGENGVELRLSGLNLFNAKPDVMKSTGISQPFDTTNYSAVGRYLSFSISGNF